MKTSDYKKLIIWQKAMDLTVEIYRLIKFLPREETYALSNQIRRAVVSVPSNIAEGHGRNSVKEFANFLSISRGSLLEVETQLEICSRLGYLKNDESTKANLLIIEINKMTNAMISYLRKKQLTTNN